MKTILDTIIAVKQSEVAQLKKRFNYRDFEQMQGFSKPVKSLANSLLEKDFGIIAEIKRESPSAGIINANLNIEQTARTYQEVGSAGISCLTDTNFFGGSNSDLSRVKSVSNLPVLRKEFIIDEIQIFESKAIGADAILLIAEILDYQTALNFTIIAQSLGMEVLMELHNASELQKINDQVNLIGINNRDLRLQKTNLETSFTLKPYLPSAIPVISESGIKSGEEVQQLKDAGFAGALIGESILNKVHPREFFEQLKSPIC